MRTIIRTKIDTEKDKNIIITKQGDNVQRTGVLSLSQEKMLMERAGKALTKTIAKHTKEAEADIVIQRKTKEVLDIIDEKRRLDKEIGENKIKMERLRKERAEIFQAIENQATENQKE